MMVKLRSGRSKAHIAPVVECNCRLKCLISLLFCFPFSRLATSKLRGEGWGAGLDWAVEDGQKRAAERKGRVRVKNMSELVKVAREPRRGYGTRSDTSLGSDGARAERAAEQVRSD